MKNVEAVIRPLQEAGLVVDRLQLDDTPAKNLLSCTIFGEPQDGEIVCYHWACWLYSEKGEYVVTPHGTTNRIPCPEFRLQSVDEAISLILFFYQRRLLSRNNGREVWQHDQKLFEEWQTTRQLLEKGDHNE